MADGYTKKQIEDLREKATAEAEEIIKIMEQEGLLPLDEIADKDVEIAKEAVKTTIVIMRMPGEAKTRLAAARTLLEYTKQKPAAKSDVTIAKAEDFLAALAAKDTQK